MHDDDLKDEILVTSDDNQIKKINIILVMWEFHVLILCSLFLKSMFTDVILKQFGLVEINENKCQ